MDQLLFDKLVYLDRLKHGGFSEEQARSAADALHEALRESVATKSDIGAVENKIALAVRDLKIWTGSMAIALFAALAAIKFFG